MKLKVLTLLILSAPLVTTAYAQSVFTAHLVGFQEAPAVVSTGTGHARLTISDDEKSIAWKLTYSGLEGSTVPNGVVTQAHVHVGQPNVAGGVAVFFCGGPLPAGPITRPACPASGTISGTWSAEDVVGPVSQGVDPSDPNGENAFARLIKAIKLGRAYANVHSTRSPSGEIRGQLARAEHDDDNESPDQ
jgi:hypothetical protein